MNIAINLHQYFKGKIGGLENYVRHVVASMDAHEAENGQVLTIFAAQEEVEHVKEFAPHARIMPLDLGNAIQIIENTLKQEEYRLLFCPLLVLEPLDVGIPSAVMMPDIQHEFFPEFFEPEVLRWRRHNYGHSAQRADIVFTLSEHTKGTIVDKYGITPDKIEVIYLDVDREFDEPPAAEALAAVKRLGLPKDYLLFPANFWPHKNHTNLFRAMQILLARYPKLGLVLTGATSTGADRIGKEIAALGIKDNIRMLGYQDRDVIVELYRGARALAFVSKYEGFGIPILEAFHTGTPVITSRAGSCEEVAGDAAVLIDPDDPVSISSGVEQTLEDPELCRLLVDKGKKRSQQFSWERAVSRTLAAFDRITELPRNHPSLEIRDYPLVSVVTPTLNMVRFLEETIRSVLSQNYPHIDYIVMDGGSTDGSLEILQKYNKELRYVSKPDQGPADAINRGFELSRGSIFAYLNADDTYLPGAVEKAVRHMLANPSIGVVYGDAYHVRQSGQVIGPYSTQPFDLQMLNRTCFICQPAAFMRRQAFSTVAGMDTRRHFAFDYDLWIRIAKLFPMMKVNDFLATSRLYPGNITLGRRSEVYREIIEITKFHYGYVPQDWIFGYASYLIDGKDGFFQVSQPTLTKFGVSVILGSYYNSAQLIRYWKECANWFKTLFFQ